MYNAQSVADNIKKLLSAKHITGKKLCQDCDLGVNTISNIRRGDVKSIETFIIIADYLEVSIDFLLGRTETNSFQNSMSKNHKRIFEIFTDLSEDNQDILIGEALKLKKEQAYEEADRQYKQAK